MARSRVPLRLSLARETLRRLGDVQLSQVRGGSGCQVAAEMDAAIGNADRSEVVCPVVPVVLEKRA